MNLIIAENKQSVNGAIGTGLVNDTIPADLVKGDSSPAVTDNAIALNTPPGHSQNGLGKKYQTAKHFAEWTKGSGISVEITEKCLESIDDRQKIGKFLGWNGYPAQNPPGWICTGISLLTLKPLPFGQFKPDTPIWFPDKDKPAKYLTPSHIPYDAFVPNIRNWTEIIEDATIPIDIGEGFKKLGALETCDRVAVGLAGVEMGLRKGKLVPNLDALAVRGRVFNICFDRDQKEKEGVVVAITKLATALLNKKSMVNVIPPWDESLGKGIDDVLANHGPEKVEEIMQTAIPYKQWLEGLEGQFKNKKETLPKGKITPADIVAREIADEYRSELAYNNESGLWMRYENGVWTAEKIEFIESIVYQILTSKGIEGYNGNTYISNIVKILRHQLIIKKWQERSPNELIPFENGVLEVATGKLLPHSPGYRFTWSMPRQHDPLAKNWGTIDNFLTEATGNNSAIKKLLICFCNAVMKGRHDLQKFLHLTGPGGSGKGTFIRLLTDLIGQNNTHSSSLSDWCGGGFETFNAYKKRLIVFPDEDKKVGNLGRFKSLTGGDFLRGEEKRMTAFNFKYEGMVVLASNFPIFQGDNSSGMTRRTVQVRFGHVPSNGDRKDLNALFQPELSAFINHLLSIPDETVRDEILNAGNISELDNQFTENLIRTNSIAAWYSEMVIYDPAAVTAIGSDKNEGENGNTPMSLFGSYCLYTKGTGGQAKSVTNFSPDLLELCNNILKQPVEKVLIRNRKFIKGLRLRVKGTDDDIPTLEASRCYDPVTTCYDPVTTCDTTKTLTQQDCYDCYDLNQVQNQDQKNIEETEKNNILAPITPPQVVTVVTSQVQQGFEVVTEPVSKVVSKVVTAEPEPEPDLTNYPHLASNDLRAKKNEVKKIKEGIFSCTSVEGFWEWVSGNGEYSESQINWVLGNALSPAEDSMFKKMTAISQPSLNFF